MMLNGYELPNPQGLDRKTLKVSEEATLANGARRNYRRGPRGSRFQWVISWTRLRPSRVAELEVVVSPDEPMLFEDVTGKIYTVYADELPDVKLIAGTDPPLAAVSITVSEAGA